MSFYDDARAAEDVFDVFPSEDDAPQPVDEFKKWCFKLAAQPKKVMKMEHSMGIK